MLRKILVHMEDHVRNLVIWGVISWTTLFIFNRKLFPERSFDICKRSVSSIHAILVVTLASLSVQDWRCPSYPLASKPSPSQTRALAVGLSYMLYDLICCLFGQRIKIDSVIHHVVCILGIGVGLVYETSGTEMVIALLITEISSPFLHLRELLKELGYKDTNLNLVVDILFAIIFTLGRMIYGPYHAFLSLSASNPPFIKCMGMGLQLVSAFWFYKIARMAKYELTKRTKSI